MAAAVARPQRSFGPAATWSPLQAAKTITRCTQATQLSNAVLGRDIPCALRRWAVADRSFLLVVPDIDAVVEMYLAAGQWDRDPYWCEPWPSALAMAEDLLQRPDLVAGKRVCELGAGLGLAGLAAAMAGASEVVLLDREPLALQCALLNAALNGLPTLASPPAEAPAEAAAAAGKSVAEGGPAVAGHKGGVGSIGRCAGSSMQARSLEQLLPYLQAADVRQVAEQQQLLTEQRQAGSSHGHTRKSSSSGSGSIGSGGGGGIVHAEVFDWSQPVTIRPHEVMLVCDCLYEAFSVQPVAAVAPQLLTLHGSRLLLADPPDRARHNRECFLDLLCEEGGEFVLEESLEKVVEIQEPNRKEARGVPVAMMHLRRAAGVDTVGPKLGRGGQCKGL